MRVILFLVFLAFPLAAYAGGPVPQSRDEAIKQLRDQIAKLETMSDSEWEQRHTQNRARRQIEKNKKMMQPTGQKSQQQQSQQPQQQFEPVQPTVPTPSVPTQVAAPLPPADNGDQFKAFEDPAPASPQQPAQPQPPSQ